MQIVKWSLQEDVADMALRITGHLHVDKSLAPGGAAVPVPRWSVLCPGDVTCSTTESS